MKKNILTAIICIAVVGVTFIICLETKGSDDIQYKVIEYPMLPEELHHGEDNPFIYFDKVEVANSAKENPEYVNISIFVGKAHNPQEAIEKWAKNVHELEKQYKSVQKKHWLSHSLYGNFCWSKKAPCIEIRYRTKKEKYPRNGWYIFTSSPCPPHKGEADYGEFFLSDEGVLMPSIRASSIAFYP